MKKIFALAMVLSVLGSVVGCGKAEDTATTPATTAGAPATDAAAKTPE